MAGRADDGRNGGGFPQSPSRPSRPPNRVTLKFGGPPLMLPDDERGIDEPPPDARPTDAPSSEEVPAPPLSLDTREIEMPEDEWDLDLSCSSEEMRALRDTDELSLELDELDELEAGAADGWGRLRGSEGLEGERVPARPRSSPPPTMSREDALELVSRRSRPPSTPGVDLASEMADRYALGDYTGALRVAELVLGRNPDDPRAKRCAESSRERLLALYSARLAAVAGISGAAAELGARVPRVSVPDHEIRWLGLDHRQGFLLSRLDGIVGIDDLVDVSGMTRLEVLKTLAELVEVGAVVLT